MTTIILIIYLIVQLLCVFIALPKVLNALKLKYENHGNQVTTDPNDVTIDLKDKDQLYREVARLMVEQNQEILDEAIKKATKIDEEKYRALNIIVVSTLPSPSAEQLEQLYKSFTGFMLINEYISMLQFTISEAWSDDNCNADMSFDIYRASPYNDGYILKPDIINVNPIESKSNIKVTSINEVWEESMVNWYNHGCPDGYDIRFKDFDTDIAIIENYKKCYREKDLSSHSMLNKIRVATAAYFFPIAKRAVLEEEPESSINYNNKSNDSVDVIFNLDDSSGLADFLKQNITVYHSIEISVMEGSNYVKVTMKGRPTELTQKGEG